MQSLGRLASVEVQKSIHEHLDNSDIKIEQQVAQNLVDNIGIKPNYAKQISELPELYILTNYGIPRVKSLKNLRISCNWDLMEAKFENERAYASLSLEDKRKKNIERNKKFDIFVKSISDNLDEPIFGYSLPRSESISLRALLIEYVSGGHIPLNAIYSQPHWKHRKKHIINKLFK